MGKLLNRTGGVINWLAYIWLVTSETFEEVCQATLGDSIRGIVSASETRQYAPKGGQRILSRQSNIAKVADTL